MAAIAARNALDPELSLPEAEDIAYAALTRGPSHLTIERRSLDRRPVRTLVDPSPQLLCSDRALFDAGGRLHMRSTHNGVFDAPSNAYVGVVFGIQICR